MGMDTTDYKLMTRIADSLERIAKALEEKNAKPVTMSSVRQRTTGLATVTTASKPVPNGADVAAAISVYVEAWQTRYGTKARPDLSGKMRGILQRVVAERGIVDTAELLQVFCQMDDAWFVTKRHDLVTFESNIGKIALASAAGHEKTDVNWQNVFGDSDAKQNALSGADSATLENVRGEDVPGGAVKTLLSGVRDDV